MIQSIYPTHYLIMFNTNQVDEPLAFLVLEALTIVSVPRQASIIGLYGIRCVDIELNFFHYCFQDKPAYSSRHRAS